jgi:hypothetical protein
VPRNANGKKLKPAGPNPRKVGTTGNGAAAPRLPATGTNLEAGVEPNVPPPNMGKNTRKEVRNASRKRANENVPKPVGVRKTKKALASMTFNPQPRPSMPESAKVPKDNSENDGPNVPGSFSNANATVVNNPLQKIKEKKANSTPAPGPNRNSNANSKENKKLANASAARRKAQLNQSGENEPKLIPRKKRKTRRNRR